MCRQVALAYQAKERELLVKEAAIYSIFMYDGQVGNVARVRQYPNSPGDLTLKPAYFAHICARHSAWSSVPQDVTARSELTTQRARRPQGFIYLHGNELVVGTDCASHVLRRRKRWQSWTATWRSWGSACSMRPRSWPTTPRTSRRQRRGEVPAASLCKRRFPCFMAAHMKPQQSISSTLAKEARRPEQHGRWVCVECKQSQCSAAVDTYGLFPHGIGPALDSVGRRLDHRAYLQRPGQQSGLAVFSRACLRRFKESDRVRAADQAELDAAAAEITEVSLTLTLTLTLTVTNKSAFTGDA